MQTLKTLDVSEVESAICETRALFTLEKYRFIGGLGSAVAEVVAEADWPRISLQTTWPAIDVFTPHRRADIYLLAMHGLNDAVVSSCVLAIVGKRQSNGAATAA